MIFYDDVHGIKDIFSLEWMLVSVVIALISAIIIALCSKKFFQILQQSGYETRGYGKWLLRRGNVFTSRLVMLSMLSAFAYVLFAACFAFLNKSWVSFAAFGFYAFFLAVYLFGDRRHKDKCPIKFTARMKRLYAVELIISFVLSLAVVIGVNALGYAFSESKIFAELRLALVCLLPLSVPAVVALAGIVTKPFENANNKKYAAKAKKRLAGFDGLIKIGITGSYGKTTVKEMLKTVLSGRFKVYATPASYNTPTGIGIAVSALDESVDVFIAEMGARRAGDVKELCDLVRPDHAIITGIAPQHVETFGSIETIIKTKAELAEATDGYIILNADCAAAAKIEKLYPNKKYVYAGAHSGEVTAENIVSDKNGSKFILNVFGERVRCSTVLLGEHNVSNICVAAAVAAKLGMSAAEIAAGVSKIKRVSHRLEIIDNDAGATIIDDSYNANAEGVRAALKVLSSFGGRRIVVTPGLVELGHAEKRENEEFGRLIADVADLVILVGLYTAYEVRSGLLKAGFPLENIIMVKELDDAKAKLAEILKRGDTVLFENDLPDKFS